MSLYTHIYRHSLFCLIIFLYPLSLHWVLGLISVFHLSPMILCIEDLGTLSLNFGSRETGPEPAWVRLQGELLGWPCRMPSLWRASVFPPLEPAQPLHRRCEPRKGRGVAFIAEAPDRGGEWAGDKQVSLCKVPACTLHGRGVSCDPSPLKWTGGRWQPYSAPVTKQGPD